jgi:hypothetical protein
VVDRKEESKEKTKHLLNSYYIFVLNFFNKLKMIRLSNHLPISIIMGKSAVPKLFVGIVE